MTDLLPVLGHHFPEDHHQPALEGHIVAPVVLIAEMIELLLDPVQLVGGADPLHPLLVIRKGHQTELLVIRLAVPRHTFIQVDCT